MFLGMMTGKVGTWRHTGAALLVGLFLIYYVSATMFVHSHVTGKGTIVHSHIFFHGHQKAPSGGHTSSELLLIAHLDCILCSCSGIVEVDFIPPVKAVPDYVISCVVEIVTGQWRMVPMWAPPYSFF